MNEKKRTRNTGIVKIESMGVDDSDPNIHWFDCAILELKDQAAAEKWIVENGITGTKYRIIRVMKTVVRTEVKQGAIEEI